MILLWNLVFIQLFALCLGACYFSAELQGEYVMQTVAAGAQVQYSRVLVTPEAIPVWGLCQQRQGDNVILNDSFNGTACIRCFHLKLYSPNVLQVHTCPTCLDQCFLSEEAARNTCPMADDLDHDKYKEITLFRTKELGGGNVKKMFCPINGRYTFTYNLFNQTDNRVECNPAQSQLENCADHGRGPQLDVHFQGCSQQYNEMKFECLGDWNGPGNQRYLALLDTSTAASSERQPQYRCALYKEDEERGNVMMAFSSDSTCSTDLYNASYGHMTWNLTAVPSKPWPALVSSSKCSFPFWSQGKWEHFNVNYNSLTYKDHLSFNSYTMRCAQALDEDRFVVFSKNGCGEEVYKCIRLKHRSVNVLEFQIGLTSSPYPNNSLCGDSNFLGNVWVTQARLEGLQVSPCPVTGEYSGFIPNANSLCARLASDQLHPETMYFTVSDCEQHEVYEGRLRSRRYKRQDEETVGEVIASANDESYASNDSSSTESMTTLESTTTSQIETTTIHSHSPISFSNEEVATSEVYLPQILTTVNDSEQVESSIASETITVGSRPVYVLRLNNSSPNDQTPSTPMTVRPYRSFQPPQWGTSSVTPSTTTLSWYSIHNNRNNSYHQINPRPDHDWHFRPSDSHYEKSSTEFPPRVFYTDNAHGRGYDPGSWTHRVRQFGDNNMSSYDMRNNWNSGHYREGYVNRPQPTTNSGFPYRGEGWNYQNPRQNWNWDGRYRTPMTPMNFPYRPYQNTDPNYRQPIALPPIQLPPLYVDSNKPMQGASSIGHRQFFREEREYQCLGQWEEDGVTYTYTQRKDFGTYECFVGSIVSNNEIYIKEAGEHCGRGIDPMRLGMKLQTKAVNNKLPETNPPPSEPVTSWYVTSAPTKPWKPITAPPRHSGGQRTAVTGIVTVVLAVLLSLRC